MATAKEKLIASAQKLVEKGSFEKAIKEYLRVVQEDNADVRIWLKIGDLYAKIGKKTEATDTYQRVASFYSDQGFYLKSVAVYKQILKLEPRLVDVNQRLAELYKQLGLISDAISQYEQVAAFFHKEGKVKDALSAMKQIVDLDPETVAARIKLAEMYSREQMPREAIEEFTRAAEQLNEQGRLDEYMKVAERLLFHAPDNKPVTRELARLYIEKNDPRRALPKLQVLFKADPRDLDVLRLLARAFEGLEQRPKAVSVYKELARILVETGDARGAADVFRQILVIQPDDADAAASLKNAPVPPSSARVAPPPNLVSTGAARAHATGAERALDSGGNRALKDPARGVPAGVPEPEGTGDVVSEEIAKILSETDVYIKYNLHAKAIDHLQRVFERQPRHVAAREKLKALYITIGRKDDAIMELWALADAAEQGRARRYIREIFELDPSNARAAQVLGEQIRSPHAVSTPEPEPEDDFGVSMPVDFGLPSASRPQPQAYPQVRRPEIEVAEESDDVELDADIVDESEPIAVSDLELEEEGAAEFAPNPSIVEAVDDDDLIPVVVDTGADLSAPTRLLAEDDDSDRFSLDESELQAALPPERATPDAETRFGGPRAIAKAAPSAVQSDESELSFAGLDGVEERTGQMSADELSAFDDPSPQRTTAFAPAVTMVSTSTVPAEAEELEPPPTHESSVRRYPQAPIPDPIRAESSLEDDLDESDFFMQQSLFDEARSMLASLLERYPDHPLVTAKQKELEAMDSGQMATAEQTTFSPIPPSSPEMDAVPLEHISSEHALSAQLPTELPGDAMSSSTVVGSGHTKTSSAPVEVTRRGVIERGVSAEDFETHYDLGIAYKEMGLIDDAIAEFRIVMREPVREVQCQLMIGLCYLEKQMFTEAINQFKKGLYVEGITDTEALSLYYELGQAYEKIGDPREALYYYDKVQKRDAAFRDLPRRLRALRGEESVVAPAPTVRNDDVDDAFDSLLDENPR